MKNKKNTAKGGEVKHDVSCLTSPCTIEELDDWLNVAEEKELVLRPEQFQKLTPLVVEFNRESEGSTMTPRKLAALIGLVNESQKSEEDRDEMLGLLCVFLQMPKHLLSRTMHRLARSTNPTVRNMIIRAVLRAYPTIDMTEAAQPDPYAYASFNAFFTRALRPGAREIAGGANVIASPVDGTVSQVGRITNGQVYQAKGSHYTTDALLADDASAARYRGGAFACVYLAPYNYHRIHMPLEGRLTATRYVPGELFSVNAATVRAVPGLFARNERVVCEFDTALGPMAMVLVGALFVGSIETVYAGEVNPPPTRGGAVRRIDVGLGTEFAKGAEIGRFNMGSTVILLLGNGAIRFADRLGAGATVRLGQWLATAE
jgi:phosphatidylserine decarboxylase